jgi:hypothetical protein
VPTTATSLIAPAREVETSTAEEERRFHNYVGHKIPWWVRAMWIVFWMFAIWYMIRNFLPALDIEVISSP